MVLCDYFVTVCICSGGLETPTMEKQFLVEHYWTPFEAWRGYALGRFPKQPSANSKQQFCAHYASARISRV